MNIAIYCIGAARDEGTLSQIGGCGVVLVAVDEYSRVQSREFSFGLANSNRVLSEIQACRLAFASIIPRFRSGNVTLFIECPDVAEFLTSDVTLVGFKDQILDLRKWRKYYKNLSVNVVTGSNQRLDRARELANLGLKSQNNTDSKTREEKHVGET